ncbi:MAG: glycosyltransferase [Lachnospiraceae bacterium]|nr:glycosyltransferase [Lachnospiraceae bacterium]
MKILMYRYGSICEPDIMEAFSQLGLEVIEEKTEMENKKLTPADQVELVSKAIEKQRPLFIFSVNFFPAIAEVCHLYGIKYGCWTVDSPVMELFSRSVSYETNRLFLFDRAQFDRFRPYNEKGIRHLPLASAVQRFDQVIRSITEKDREKYSKNVAFVGSLYEEKNPLNRIKTLDEYEKGYIRGVVEASLKVMGYNFMEEAVTDQIAEALKRADPDFYQAKDSLEDCSRYVAAHEYLGMQAAETERIRTLNTLAEYFTVDLYTRSDTSELNRVQVHGGIRTLDEMPKVFHLSKINLNMTIKPIQTGLPLRIFDILGCGGFLMTNYQQELTEHFEIGVDLEAYGSMEELVDKCAYYLQHEDERIRIAKNGYEKVKQYHTYTHRMVEIIRGMSE